MRQFRTLCAALSMSREAFVSQMRGIARDSALFSDRFIGLHENRKVPPWAQFRTLQERAIDDEYSVRFGDVELQRQWNITRKR